jgi:TonB-linked SusC/RagA family outer membrane protein
MVYFIQNLQLRQFLTLVVILFSGCIVAQKTITGTIKSEKDGQTLPGVSVLIKDTSLGTTTDLDGNYSLKVPSDNTVLVFSFIGMTTKEVVVGNQTVIDLNLQEDAKIIEEVIIVGFGLQKKVSVVASISQIGTRDLKLAPVTNLSNSLTGRLPGLITLQASGQPGADAASMLIRGRSSLTNTNPLILVDGVERDFRTVDANEVENISILKDASATAVYGVRGANGVILVTTRRGAEGKKSISFTTNTGIQVPTRLPKFLGAYDFAVLLNEALANEGRTLKYSEQQLEGWNKKLDPYLYPDVDYVNEFIKKSAPEFSANLNISGGSKTIKYFISGSYLDQYGMLKHTNDTDLDGSINYKRWLSSIKYMIILGCFL